MINLTKEQRKAVHRTFLRYSHADCFNPVTDTYRVFRKRVQPMICGYGAIVLQPADNSIWIAIETDGYTHS